MPQYIYELVDASSGEALATVCLARRVAERDAVALRRCTVPESVGTERPAESAGDNVLRTAYRAEQRMGSTREFRRRLGFSPETIRRVWAG